MSIFREIFHYSKTETLGVVFLLFLMIIGGGILLYQKTTQSLPPELFIETHNVQESVKKKSSNVKINQNRNYLLTELSENKININTAPPESLQLLPYIGQVTANRIIEYREQVGKFDSLSQLIDVKGIGEKRLKQIQQYLSVK